MYIYSAFSSSLSTMSLRAATDSNYTFPVLDLSFPWNIRSATFTISRV